MVCKELIKLFSMLLSSFHVRLSDNHLAFPVGLIYTYIYSVVKKYVLMPELSWWIRFNIQGLNPKVPCGCKYLTVFNCCLLPHT